MTKQEPATDKTFYLKITYAKAKYLNLKRQQILDDSPNPWRMKSGPLHIYVLWAITLMPQEQETLSYKIVIHIHKYIQKYPASPEH